MGVFALAAGLASAAAADLDDGIAAYDRTDFIAAYDAFLPLARQGDAAATNYLGALYFRGAGVMRNDDAALELFRRAAEDGQKEAAHNLGLIYKLGRGVPADPGRAATWFRVAVRAGLADAQYQLALLHRDGIGVPKDPAAFERLLKAAAEQGYLPAQRALGDLYGKEGSGERASQAEEWYRRAAESGDAGAQFRLAERLRTRDPREAALWYSRAAEQGNAIAQNTLGILYARGEGVEPDLAQSVFWHRKAAEQGDADAETRLGVRLNNGQGVAADPALAVTWFRKAAAQGYGPAQLRLAEAYMLGRGVARDPKAARRWFAAAAFSLEDPREREKAARLRDQVGGKPSQAARPAQPHPAMTAAVMTDPAPAPAHRPHTSHTPPQTGDADLPAVAGPDGDIAKKPRLIQRLLSDLDFDPGPVDGVLGKKTAEALSQFQAFYGLAETGQIDADSARELYRAHRAQAPEIFNTKHSGTSATRRRLGGPAFIVDDGGEAVVALSQVESCREIRILRAPNWISKPAEDVGMIGLDRASGLALITTGGHSAATIGIAGHNPAVGTKIRRVGWAPDDVLATGPRVEQARAEAEEPPLPPGQAILDADGALAALATADGGEASPDAIRAFLSTHEIDAAQPHRSNAEASIVRIECWE